MSFEDDEYWDEEYSDRSAARNAAVAREPRYARPAGPQPVIPTRRGDAPHRPAEDDQVDELAARRQRRATGNTAPPTGRRVFDSGRPSWLDDPDFVPIDTSQPHLADAYGDVDINRPELAIDFDATDDPFADPVADPSARPRPEDPWARFSSYDDDIDEPYDHREAGPATSARPAAEPPRPAPGPSHTPAGPPRPATGPSRATPPPAGPTRVTPPPAGPTRVTPPPAGPSRVVQTPAAGPAWEARPPAAAPRPVQLPAAGPSRTVQTPAARPPGAGQSPAAGLSWSAQSPAAGSSRAGHHPGAGYERIAEPGDYDQFRPAAAKRDRTDAAPGGRPAGQTPSGNGPRDDNGAASRSEAAWAGPVEQVDDRGWTAHATGSAPVIGPGRPTPPELADGTRGPAEPGEQRREPGLGSGPISGPRSRQNPRTAHVVLSEDDGPWSMVPDAAPRLPRPVSGPVRPGYLQPGLPSEANPVSPSPRTGIPPTDQPLRFPYAASPAASTHGDPARDPRLVNPPPADPGRTGEPIPATTYRDPARTDRPVSPAAHGDAARTATPRPGRPVSPAPGAASTPLAAYPQTHPGHRDPAAGPVQPGQPAAYGGPMQDSRSVAEPPLRRPASDRGPVRNGEPPREPGPIQDRRAGRETEPAQENPAARDAPTSQDGRTGRVGGPVQGHPAARDGGPVQGRSADRDGWAGQDGRPGRGRDSGFGGVAPDAREEFGGAYAGPGRPSWMDADTGEVPVVGYASGPRAERRSPADPASAGIVRVDATESWLTLTTAEQPQVPASGQQADLRGEAVGSGPVGSDSGRQDALGAGERIRAEAEPEVVDGEPAGEPVRVLAHVGPPVHEGPGDPVTPDERSQVRHEQDLPEPPGNPTGIGEDTREATTHEVSARDQDAQARVVPASRQPLPMETRIADLATARRAAVDQHDQARVEEFETAPLARDEAAQTPVGQLVESRQDKAAGERVVTVAARSGGPADAERPPAGGPGRPAVVTPGGGPARPTTLASLPPHPRKAATPPAGDPGRVPDAAGPGLGRPADEVRPGESTDAGPATAVADLGGAARVPAWAAVTPVAQPVLPAQRPPSEASLHARPSEASALPGPGEWPPQATTAAGTQQQAGETAGHEQQAGESAGDGRAAGERPRPAGGKAHGSERLGAHAAPYMDPDGTLHNLKPISRLDVSGPDQEPRRAGDTDFTGLWFSAHPDAPQDDAAKPGADDSPASAKPEPGTPVKPGSSTSAQPQPGTPAVVAEGDTRAGSDDPAGVADAVESNRATGEQIAAGTAAKGDGVDGVAAEDPMQEATGGTVTTSGTPETVAGSPGREGRGGASGGAGVGGTEGAGGGLDGVPEKDEGPAAAHLSAEDLQLIRWRLDGASLREIVDDREALRELGERLDGPLSGEGDNVARAGLLSVRAEVYRLLGELGMAAAASRLALAHAESARDTQSTVIAQAELAHVLRLRGDFKEADRLFARATTAQVPEPLRSVVHENAGRSCFDQGRHMEALDHFANALRLAGEEDPELAERIGVCLEAVYIHVLRDGWGPYPRDARDIIER